MNCCAQERIRIPDDKMAYYMDLAEMYVGDDVSPDFYGWVFPKYDHVAVGAHQPHTLKLPWACFQILQGFLPLSSQLGATWDEPLTNLGENACQGVSVGMFCQRVVPTCDWKLMFPCSD